MKESDLYEPVKKWLLANHSEKVYAEVGVIDVVGVSDTDNIVTTIELKLSLSFKLIEQAIRSSSYGNLNYVAIPKPKKKPSYLAFKLLEEHNIGLLYVNETPTGRYTVKEVLECEPKKTVGRYNIRKIIKPIHENLIGGVKSGDGETPYSTMMKEIMEYLKDKDFVTVDEIIANVPITNEHYKNPKSTLPSTLSEKWNKDKIETKIIKRKKHYKLK